MKKVKFNTFQSKEGLQKLDLTRCLGKYQILKR